MIMFFVKVLKQKEEKTEERLQAETEITFGRKPASTHSDPARKHPDRPPLTNSHHVMSPRAHRDRPKRPSVNASSYFRM